MRFILPVLLVVALGIFPGCLKQDLPDFYSDVDGTVLRNGEPVEGAEIHIRNHYDPGGFVIHTKEQNDIDITFEVLQPVLYTANLFRYQIDTTFATFFRDSLETGEQTIEIPDSLLSNGVFAYQVFNEINQGFSGLFIINKPDSLLADTHPYITTNSSGDFTLNSLSLALGERFTSGGDNIFEITDSLQIIVVHNGEFRTKETVKIKPNTTNFFEITLD